MTDNTATLTTDGKNYEFEVYTGTENERAVDFQKLRSQTGCITIDPRLWQHWFLLLLDYLRRWCQWYT